MNIIYFIASASQSEIQHDVQSELPKVERQDIDRIVDRLTSFGADLTSIG